MSVFEVKSLLDQLNDQLDREMEKIEYLFLDCFVIKSNGGGSSGDRGQGPVVNAPSTAIDNRPYDCGDASSLNADAFPFISGVSQYPSGVSQYPDDVSQYSGRADMSQYSRGGASNAYNGSVRLHRYTSGGYRPHAFTAKKQNRAVDIIDPATGEKVV